MKEFFKMVEDFHEMSDHPIMTSPLLPTFERRVLRSNLLSEESEELEIAALDKEDIVEVCDALTDTMYVLIGACHEYGVTFEMFQELFNEVHRSNMSKSLSELVNIEEIEREIILFNSKGKKVHTIFRNGRVLFINSDTNKLEKPSTYSPANLKPIVDKYINE